MRRFAWLLLASILVASGTVAAEVPDWLDDVTGITYYYELREADGSVDEQGEVFAWFPPGERNEDSIRIRHTGPGHIWHGYMTVDLRTRRIMHAEQPEVMETFPYYPLWVPSLKEGEKALIGIGLHTILAPRIVESRNLVPAYWEGTGAWGHMKSTYFYDPSTRRLDSFVIEIEEDDGEQWTWSQREIRFELRLRYSSSCMGFDGFHCEVLLWPAIIGVGLVAAGGVAYVAHRGRGVSRLARAQPARVLASTSTRGEGGPGGSRLSANVAAAMPSTSATPTSRAFCPACGATRVGAEAFCTACGAATSPPPGRG